MNSGSERWPKINNAGKQWRDEAQSGGINLNDRRVGQSVSRVWNGLQYIKSAHGGDLKRFLMVSECVMTLQDIPEEH